MTMRDSERDSKMDGTDSRIGRRKFMKLGAASAAAAIGAGGAGAVAMLNGVAAGAQAAQGGGAASPSSAASQATQGTHGTPWWAARPTNGKVGKPEAIDLHSHWSPEPYDKALAAIGQPLNNPFPLDYDLDKRRQWMDEHGD